MRKYRLHILFWLAYAAQHTFLQIVHMHLLMHSMPFGKQLVLGIASTFIILPAKIPVAYFALYVLLPAILSDKRRMLMQALGMVAITAVSVVYYWGTYRYVINPVLYSGYEDADASAAFLYFWIATWEIWSVSAIAVIIKFVRLQVQSRQRERTLVKERLETELKFLRSQTNPHFLFNTLNNIYALALKKSPETPGFVLKLSKLMHFMLYGSAKALIPIGDEIKILDDYIELEKIRYNNRLEIVFDRVIDNEQDCIAPLLLLSFVENAFKHGASESRFQSYIHIDMQVHAGQLTFAIENTREDCGRSGLNGKIGLANVRRQIELLYAEYRLNVEDKAAIFKVNLAINLHSHGKI